MTVYNLKNIQTKLSEFTLNIDNCVLEEGCVYAVTGPNGCGKTTFLNLLSFAARPVEGEMVFKGKSVSYENGELLTVRRQVSYLMQEPYLFNMSVEENIGYGLKIRGVAKTEISAKAGEIMEELSLSHLSSRPAHELSGGEAQRVAIARTLVLDTGVFLLDEPTANTDKKNIGVVEDIIIRLGHEKKATVVFTTHSDNQAERLSENIIKMEDGRIS